jgi:8-oxo-dGTP pyrophosphatase MutT (NUDIX family)
VRIRLNWFDGKLAKRIADIAAGELEPAATRNAATVMVVRDAPGGGVEVLMLKRPAAMKFAGGAYVFPGGSVDSADFGDVAPGDGDVARGDGDVARGDGDVARGDGPGGPAGAGTRAKAAWHGPSAQEFGQRLGATPELARALVSAAVRETFEEAGVLLAGTQDGAVVVPEGPDWEADRAALNEGTVSLAGLLDRRGLVLRADLLTPWAQWITPLAEPKRFDTRFFAAALPAGQQVTAHAAEADKIVWVRPDDALNAARRGEMSLLPPTATTLAEFTLASGVADILGRTRKVAPIQPVLVNSEDGQAWLEVPDGVGYPL